MASVLPFFTTALAVARPARPAIRIAAIALVAGGALAVSAGVVVAVDRRRSGRAAVSGRPGRAGRRRLRDARSFARTAPAASLDRLRSGHRGGAGRCGDGHRDACRLRPGGRAMGPAQACPRVAERLRLPVVDRRGDADPPRADRRRNRIRPRRSATLAVAGSSSGRRSSRSAWRPERPPPGRHAIELVGRSRWLATAWRCSGHTGSGRRTQPGIDYVVEPAAARSGSWWRPSCRRRSSRWARTRRRGRSRPCAPLGSGGWRRSSSARGATCCRPSGPGPGSRRRSVLGRGPRPASRRSTRGGVADVWRDNPWPAWRSGGLVGRAGSRRLRIPGASGQTLVGLRGRQRRGVADARGADQARRLRDPRRARACARHGRRAHERASRRPGAAHPGAVPAPGDDRPGPRRTGGGRDRPAGRLPARATGGVDLAA